MITRSQILSKLPFIFPVGTPCRNSCISETAACAIYTMISKGAIEGLSVYINPRHILRTNRGQFYKANIAKRPLYVTLSHGLIPAGAVKVLPGVHSNPYKPKYYLEKEFALLFEMSGDKNIFSWQKNHFVEETLNTISLIQGATQRLPAHQKKLFIMIRYENHLRREAADKLGLSVSALNKDLSKAIKFIRKRTHVHKI